MHQFIAWLSMDGYGPYVWSAYGLVTTVLLLHLWGCRVQKKRIQRTLKTWFKRMST